jgi:hypothetical protein
MGLPGQTLFQNGSDRIDLLIGNGCTLPANADEVEDAIGAKYLQAIFVGRHNPDEDITAKQWHFDRSPAVAPAVNLGEQRQECGHALFPEPYRHNSFVARTSLYGIPAFVAADDGLRSAREFPCVIGRGHSFAL